VQNLYTYDGHLVSVQMLWLDLQTGEVLKAYTGKFAVGQLVSGVDVSPDGSTVFVPMIETGQTFLFRASRPTAVTVE
jgi:hypothetical protein